MELERAMDEQISAVTTTAGDAPSLIGRPDPEAPPFPRIPAADSTPVLRQCTALAARARVELLSVHSHAAAEELSQLLAAMGRWDADMLETPDPTMTVLCAAALQDLAERLGPSAGELGARVETALELLHSVMGKGRIGAPA